MAALDAALHRAIAALYGLPWLLLALAALFWAANTVAGRLAVGEISPMMLTALRWSVVLGVLWPLHGAEVTRRWPEIRPQAGRIAAMGALGFTAFNALFYLAAYETTAVNLGILQGAIPIFVLAGAYLAYRTPVTAVQVAGVVLTSIGVIVVATRGDPMAAFRDGLNRGDLAMIVGSALYAAYAVGLQKRPAMPGPVFFTLLALVAAVSALPLVAIEAAVIGWRMPSVQGFAVMLFVAIFPSCLAQLFFMRGVDLVGAGRAGVFINLVPVFAALFGVGLLGEPFAWYHAAAMVLVFSGIALAQRIPPAVKPT